MGKLVGFSDRRALRMAIMLMAISAVRVPKANAVAELCRNPWKETLKTDRYGREVRGSKKELIAAVSGLAELKVMRVSTERIMKTTSARVHDDNVCAQFFPDNHFAVLIRYYIVCTTGHIHILKSDGEVNKVSDEMKAREPFVWFTRQTAVKPTLSADDRNRVTAGSFSDLRAAVQMGQDIRVFIKATKTALPIHALQYSASEVTAQNVRLLNYDEKNTHHEFPPKPERLFTALGTSRGVVTSAWKMGNHTGLHTSSYDSSVSWFVDPCWTLDYVSGGSKQIFSRGNLVDKVRNGHRIRVRIGSAVMKASTIFLLKDDHVTIQVTDQVNVTSDRSLGHDLYWKWQLISTKGWVTTLYHQAEGDAKSGEAVTYEEVHWYTDSNIGVKIPVRNRKVEKRQLKFVRSKVKTGSDLRVGFNRAAGELPFKLYGTSVVHLLPGPFFEAQSSKISVQLSNRRLSFGRNPTRVFNIFYSFGKLRKTYWDVGKYTTFKPINHVYKLFHWFLYN